CAKNNDGYRAWFAYW
nr:immunoglobulin heavy chain junction region [Mus musculus]MBK4184515.1 immunoglobulin heavy chain junction region [Mus musculus]MBK4184842.1 immunoglobulin heavy chain junction region [Mus musculus]MBK4185806.1 immunoglobulin heavy chain junction region [Mus musculus]MBK4189856.1 immunoglobulin heavy chain junction region [Mus musculus]